ncbi:hypothetical protein TNIN_398891 [Trichonephila inaurata madagascariensis]|uniref:Uncharacterized protein n=1 Tax=Trichonephila inaurata madagascariensis TaxID=2747483 RepID=A0A8X6IJX4_9ARAC|nr:hypothetical protein TNIN_398891 [Trichonephila inaurata madagascariensis]
MLRSKYNTLSFKEYTSNNDPCSCLRRIKFSLHKTLIHSSILTSDLSHLQQIRIRKYYLGLGSSVIISFLHTTEPDGFPNTEQFKVAVLPTSKRSSGGVMATR